jgi:hypothetical protein
MFAMQKDHLRATRSIASLALDHSFLRGNSDGEDLTRNRSWIGAGCRRSVQRTSPIGIFFAARH